MSKRASSELLGIYQYDKKQKMIDEYTTKSEFIFLKTDNAVDVDTQTYSFSLPASSMYVYDLKNITLCGDIAIKSRTSANGKIGTCTPRKNSSDPYDPVTVSNLPLDSCFERVEIFLNDESVLPSNFSAFRSFVEKSVSYGANAKDSTIASQMYVRDNSVSPGFNVNIAMIIRGARTELSKKVSLETKLCHDLKNLSQYIPGTVKIRVVLHRSSDRFVLLGDIEEMSEAKKTSMSDFYIELTNVRLKCKRIYLSDIGVNYMNNRIQKPLFFYFQSTQTVSAVIPPSTLNWETTLSFNRMPSRILLGLVPTKAVYGDYFTNSLYFSPYKIAEIFLKKDDTVIDTISIDGEWDENNIVPVYNKLLYLLRVTNTSLAVDISPQHFLHGGYTLFPLLGGPDNSDNFRNAACKVSIGFRFVEPVPQHGLTAMIFGLQNKEMALENGVCFVTDV